MHYFIINPRSRSGKGKQIWNQVKSKLDYSNITYKCYQTLHPGHAVEITEELTKDLSLDSGNEVTIIVLGGDGTLNEVLNGISTPERVILGYIPTGSSNDFARSLGLSKKPLKALETVLNPKYIQKMDFGLVQLENKQQRFLVSAGIGYDASVCVETGRSQIKTFLNKLKLGTLTYVTIGVKQLFKIKPIPARIVLDGTREVPVKKILFVSIHNQKYEGGGFAFCPKADNSDGFLDICIAADISKLKVLMLLPLAFQGKHIYFRGIHNYRCQSVEIFCESTSPVHTDGEVFPEQRNLSATCVKNHIQVITG